MMPPLNESIVEDVALGWLGRALAIQLFMGRVSLPVTSVGNGVIRRCGVDRLLRG